MYKDAWLKILNHMNDIFDDVFDAEQQNFKYEVNERILLQDTFDKKCYPTVQDIVAIANVSGLSQSQVKN